MAGRNMSRSIQNKLVNFICHNCLVDEDSFLLDKSLIDQGIIDSFGFVEISTFITHEFDINVLSNEMNRMNFGSVLKIVAFIESKLIQQKNEESTTTVPDLEGPAEREDGEI
jgi:acyl carrier protein